ncbi:MAG: agmatinase [Candidatus Omnitrophota bacterium]|nr:agmatinase [Candidatus Omnitrophota bacterium]
MKKFIFCGLEPEYSSWKSSKVAVLPAPYEATVTYRPGTAKGPKAIIKASGQVELYDEELEKETYKIGINTLDEPVLAGFSPEEMVDKIHRLGSEMIDSGKFPVLLGGEHTVSIGMARVLGRKYSDLSIIQFDAHADLRDSYEGSFFNHACTGRRLRELAPVITIGVRNLSREGAEFIDKTAARIVSAEQTIKHPQDCKNIISSLGENIYITIDLDVLDPSIMPAVGTPEPGGLGWYDIISLLSTIASSKKIVGFDVVELAPIPDEVYSDFLAAKLVYRLLGYIFK